MRGGTCKGYTFGKNGVSELNQPKQFQQNIVDYNNIDKSTNRKKNFADLHSKPGGNMFGKPSLNKKDAQFKYQGQYDMGNYTHQYRNDEAKYFDSKQYYHKRNPQNYDKEEKTFKNSNQNNLSKYKKELRTYGKHTTNEELNYLRKLFHLEQEHSKNNKTNNKQDNVSEFQDQQFQQNNKNILDRSYDIVNNQKFNQEEINNKNNKKTFRKQQEQQILHEIETDYH